MKRAAHARATDARTLTAILAILFLTAWFMNLIGAMTSGGCLNPSKPDTTRMRLCKAAMTMNPWTLGRFEPGKSAPIWLERGILRAGAGETGAARKDMQRAHDMAAGGRTLPGRGKIRG